MKPARKLRSFPSISPLLENDSFFEHARQLQRRIARRAYEHFARNGCCNGRDLDDWLAAESEFLEPLSFAVAESEGELRLSAVVEGFNEKEIEVKVDPHRIFITARRRESSPKKKGQAAYTEQRSKEIFHEYETPVEIVPDQAKAEFQDGVLELTLPKRLPSKAGEMNGKAA